MKNLKYEQKCEFVSYLQCLTSILQLQLFHFVVSFEAHSHMKSWFAITPFTCVSSFSSSTWHISFEACYAVCVFLWMWNKNMQLPIQSLFLVRCAVSSSGGCSTILTVTSTRAMAICLLTSIWLTGLELILFQFST